MIYNPHNYQKQATEYIMNHPVCALFLSMGLGKTVITLTAIEKILKTDPSIKKVLVIAPLRVASVTWPEEIEKWDHLSHLSYSVMIGSEKIRLKALSQKADVYIINRDNVPWLVNTLGKNFNFDMVVIDELSSFKKFSAKRVKALCRVRPLIKRVVGLTGTPSSNGLMDLWAQFRVLDMGERLGRYLNHYRDLYFKPDKRNRHVIYTYKLRDGADKKIYDAISDITMSLSQEDVLKMPEKFINKIKVEMNNKEKRLYSQLKKDMILDLEGSEIDAVNAASLSNKLLQIANGAVYDENKDVHVIHDRKFKAIDEIIETSNGNPVLIAYWFKHDRERLQSHYNIKEIKTPEDIKDWNDGKIPLAMIHPASAGHGLNLQYGGSILVWFGLLWSLELYEQTNARLFRQGQSRGVVIHHIVTKDTIDEEVLNALTKKQATQEALLNAVKTQIGVM